MTDRVGRILRRAEKWRDVFVWFKDGMAVRDGSRLLGKPHYKYVWWEL